MTAPSIPFLLLSGMAEQHVQMWRDCLRIDLASRFFMDAQLRLLIHHPLGDRPAANSSACGDLSDRSNFLYLIYTNLHARMGT